jgi:anti-sigma factor RsiW
VKRLTCQEVLEQLSDYLDEDARAELVHEVNQHLGTCSHCKTEVDTIRKTIRIFVCEEQVVLPQPLRDKLNAAMEQAYRNSPGEKGTA